MKITVSILVRNRAGELKDVTSRSLTGFFKSPSVSVRQNSLAFLTEGFQIWFWNRRAWNRDLGRGLPVWVGARLSLCDAATKGHSC